MQKLQAAENNAKLMEAFLKEKEKEVLQLQVRAAGGCWAECCHHLCECLSGSPWSAVEGKCWLLPGALTVCGKDGG